MGAVFLCHTHSDKPRSQMKDLQIFQPMVQAISSPTRSQGCISKAGLRGQNLLLETLGFAWQSLCTVLQHSSLMCRFQTFLRALTSVQQPQKSALLHPVSVAKIQIVHWQFTKQPVNAGLPLVCEENNHRALTTEQQTNACCLCVFFEGINTKTPVRLSHAVNHP